MTATVLKINAAYMALFEGFAMDILMRNAAFKEKCLLMTFRASTLYVGKFPCNKM